jgi:ribosomal protein S12 methylthiotransferase accessory factor
MAGTSDIELKFPGGRKVVAVVGGHEIPTDQPVDVGGEDTAPSPFSLFVASIAACAGFYALTFCQKRELSTEGLKVRARPHSVEGTLAEVAIDVTLPPAFPEKYREALLRSVDQCSVKRAIAAQPRIAVTLA